MRSLKPNENYLDQLDRPWQFYRDDPKKPSLEQILSTKPKTKPCSWGNYGKEEFIRFEGGDCLSWDELNGWKIEKYRQAIRVKKKEGG